MNDPYVLNLCYAEYSDGWIKIIADKTVPPDQIILKRGGAEIGRIINIATGEDLTEFDDPNK